MLEVQTLGKYKLELDWPYCMIFYKTCNIKSEEDQMKTKLVIIFNQNMQKSQLSWLFELVTNF